MVLRLGDESTLHTSLAVKTFTRHNVNECVVFGRMLLLQVPHHAGTTIAPYFCSRPWPNKTSAGKNPVKPTNPRQEIHGQKAKSIGGLFFSPAKFLVIHNTSYAYVQRHKF